MVEVLLVKERLLGLVELLEVKVKEGLRGLPGMVVLRQLAGLAVLVQVGLQFQIIYHENPYHHAPVMIP